MAVTGTIIYLSEWLSRDYPKVYTSLVGALERSHAEYSILSHTREVWARDYMPIYLSNGEYATFKFAPDYLSGNKSKYITNQDLVIKGLDIKVAAHLNIVLDGGNVVRCNDKTIMTDKIISENPNIRPLKLIDTIEQTLNTELILIPWDMEEPYGHADGMVAYIGDGKLLMNNYSQMGKDGELFSKRLLKILGQHFDVQELHYEGKLSKHSWCYLNYLDLPNSIIIPALSENQQYASDQEAMRVFGNIFKDKEIILAYTKPLIMAGGAIHCVTWEKR